MKNVPATRFKKVEIEPFTRDEASHMLKACTYLKEADTTYRRRFVMRPATANRDQAIILTLLDSCVRASEFCACRIGDFDAKRGKLEIRHGIQGGAKDGKGRTVYGVANGCLAVGEPSFSGEKIAWTGYGSYRP